MKKIEQFCIFLLSSAALAVSTLIVLESKEEVRIPTRGEEFTYNIDFSSNKNQLDFQDGVTEVYSSRQYPIKFKSNGVTFSDGNVGLFNSMASFYNMYTYDEDIHQNKDYHNAISGLKSIVINYNGSGLTLSYGWNDNYDVVDEPLVSNQEYLFNNQFPSFFKVQNSYETALVVKSITLNYTCNITNNPNIDEYDFASNNDGTYQITNYKGSKGNIVLPSEYNDSLVTGIAPNAFKGNQYVSHVVIPKTISYIGASAFENCPNLKEVKTNEDVISTPSSKIKKAIRKLPKFEMKIEALAFGNCSNLEYIDLPDALKDFQQDTFTGCVKIHFLCRGNEKPNWGPLLNPLNRPILWHYAGFHGDMEGQLFAFCNYDNHGFTAVLGYTKTVGTELVIPDRIGLHKVENICDFAFAGYKFETIKFPSSLKTIGDYAFANCLKLKEVILPNSVTEIGFKCFTNCNSVTNFDTGDGLKVIPETIDSYNLKTFRIGKSVTKIEASAIKGELEELIVPDNVIDVSPSFYSNINPGQVITKIFFNGRKEHFNVDFDTGDYGARYLFNVVDNKIFTTSYGLQYCLDEHGNAILIDYVGPSSTLVIEDYIDGHPLSKDLTKYLFTDNRYLETLDIRANITAIPDHFCYFASRLSYIYLPDSVKVIGFCAFERTPIYEIVMNGVEEIQYEAFFGSYMSGIVNLPDSLRIIGDSAFCGVHSDEIHIPISVEIVEEAAFSKFSYESNLKIFCEAESKPIGWSDNWNAGGYAVIWGGSTQYEVYDGFYYETTPNYEAVITGMVDQNSYTASIPSMVVKEDGSFLNIIGIADSAFASSTIQYLYLSSPLQYIGDYAFSGCINLQEVVQYDSTVTTIGINSFSGCASLPSFPIFNSLIEIKTNAFAGCTSLTSFDIGPNVTTIGDFVFNDCTSLDYLCVPNNVYYFGETVLDELGEQIYLFQHEKPTEGFNWRYTDTTGMDYRLVFGVTDLTMHQTSDNVFNYAIIDKNGEQKINLLSYIGYDKPAKIDAVMEGYPLDLDLRERLFDDGDDYVEELTITAPITEIPDSFAASAYSLRKIVLPNTVTKIGGAAFFGSSIDEFNFNGIKEIGESAFNGADFKGKIELPDGLISIGKYAFAENIADSIFVPSTVIYLGERFFATYSKNAHIYIETSEVPSTWDPKWNEEGYPYAKGFARADYKAL